MATLMSESREMTPCGDDATQAHMDALRDMPELTPPMSFAPQTEASTSAPVDRADALAMLREHLEVERERTQRRITELDRRKLSLVRARLALEPVKEQHYDLQQRCPTENVDGWVTLAETAEDLLALEAGALNDAEARAVMAEVTQRLDDLERELADRGRSAAGRALAQHDEQRARIAEEFRRQVTEYLAGRDAQSLEPAPPVDRWPTDDDAGPASLTVRQPALSNAPPCGHGPAPHHAA